ncbi:MAG: FAD-dependent oxidoreductase [Thermodesulfobacteriota bacterium]
MSLSKERVVVIGNGMVGQSAVEHILRKKNENIELVVFGEEPDHSYNRILLSEVLSGKKSFAQLYLKKRKWFEENGVKLYTGSRVTEIDTASRRVRSEKGFSSAYDKLVIATGSVAFIPPIKGIEKSGVFAYRTIDDVWSMLEVSRYKKNAVVIGGGLLGLEAAKALKDNGMDVTVIHLVDHLMEQQLDYDSGLMLERLIERMGIKFRMKAVTEEILGNERAEAVRLASGEILDADLVLVCTGIRPNVELAKKAGVLVKKGIVVNDYLQTSHENIYALGECVEHRGMVYGLFDPLVEQARVAADSIAGNGESVYEGSLVSAVLKVAGVSLVSVGNFNGGEGCEDLVYSDPERGIYKKLVFRDNHIVGAIFLGDIKDYRKIFKLIIDRTGVNGNRHELLLGAAADNSAAKTPEKDITADEPPLKDVPLTPESPIYASQDLHPRTVKSPWLGKINPADIKSKGMEVDFERYRQEGFASIDPSDFLRLKSHGYCSQKQEGYFMRRIRVPGGQVTAPQLMTVAELAGKYGGWVHITTRQALELHWTTINDGEIDERLREVGLSTRSACGHAIRNVTCSEEAGIGGDEILDVRPWVKVAHDYIVTNSLSINKRLPRKMNVYFANSPKHRSHAMVNDIGYVAVEAEHEGSVIPGFEVWVGGSLGSKPHLSQRLIDFIPPEQTVPVLRTIIEIYSRHGNISDSRNPRLKELVELWGFDKFREEFSSIYYSKFPQLHGVEVKNDESLHGDVDKEGIYPQKQEGYYRVVVRVPLGELTAAQARTIARLSLDYADGKIQNTMQQNFELQWVRKEKLPKLLAELGAIGLAPKGSGSVLDVMACPGTTFCVWGVSNSQGTADSLIRHIGGKDYKDDEQISKLRIQISGCPNSCAQHQVADIGLSGSAGKYFLYLGGHMNGSARVGEVVRRNIAANEVNDTVDTVLRTYIEMRHDGEPFVDFVYRIGIDNLAEIIAGMLDSPEAIEARKKVAENEAVQSKDLAKGEYSVKFKVSGKTVTVKGTETILQKGLDEGLSLPFSCQQGVCGTCKLRVRGRFEQGNVEGITPEEIASGEALICMAKPRGDMEVDA